MTNSWWARALITIFTPVLVAFTVSAQTDIQREFESARAQYEQTRPPDEAARLRYVTRLAQLTERRIEERWKGNQRDSDAEKVAMAMNAELSKYPMPKISDSKKLSRLLVGQWQSPRRVYIFRANGKMGSEDGAVDSPWRIQGSQYITGSQRHPIILLNGDYFIYADGDAVFFHSRVKE